MNRKAKTIVVFLGGLFFVVAAGAVWLTEARLSAAKEVDDTLLYANALAVAAVNPDRLTGLSFSTDDNQHPDYIRLREQSIALGQIMADEHQILGIYIMKEVGGKILFVVDSAPMDDPWHTEPGVVFQEPPQGLVEMMRDSGSGLIGPHACEYGTFYSVYQPIRKDGQTVAYMGTDITAANYDRLVGRKLLAPILVAVSLFLTYCLIFIIVERRLRALSEVREREAAELRAAIESDRAKTDFISIAVHQLKAPLTALKWSVEMLESAKAERGAEENEAFQQVVGASRRLDDLVVTLLNIGRIESGRLKIEPQPTDLGSLAAGVVSELNGSVIQKKQAVAIDADADAPRINVDRGLIHEVYKNLLTNAIKFSPPGGRIEVKIKVVGTDVVSSVKDNGLGIPDGEKQLIFGKFFRASNVVALPEEGTGLGLFFAKQIVEVSGGRIWFESAEGAGTTFYFSLPLAGSKPQDGGGGQRLGLAHADKSGEKGA